MPTSYTSLLGLALPVTGELAGTWGDTVNDYLTKYLDAAVAGAQTISGSQTAVTLTTTNGSTLTQAGSGATGSAQYQIINCTGNPAGLLTITVPAQSKAYLVLNSTSTSQSVKVVGTGPTTGVTMVSGEKALIAWNGSDFVKVASSEVDGVSTISFGTTGLTPATATSGAVTVAGTLATANGGTALTTFGAANRALYSTSASALTAGTLPTAAGGTGLTSFTANGVVYASSTSALTTGSALTFDGTSLTFGSTAQRIIADMSNATIANRLFFQTSTTNGNTNLSAIPNGTSTTAGVSVFNNSDPTNASLGGITITSSTVRVQSAQVGTGTYLPLTFFTDGSEQMRLTSTGLRVNTTAANISGSERLTVNGLGTFSVSSTSVPGLYLQNTDTTASTNQPYLFLQDGTANRGGIGVNYTDSTLVLNGFGGIRFRYGGNGMGTTEGMALTSTGLGIGTSSPLAKLDVTTSGLVSSFGSASTAETYIQVKNGTSILYLGGKSDQNYVYGTAAVPLTFYTNSSERMRIDSSGNLGLGVTPSAWFASSKALQIGSAIAPYLSLAQQTTTTSDGYLMWGARLTGDRAFAYQTTGDAVVAYRQNAGTHAWFTAPSGTAGNAISFTQAMTLDASGNLGVGTTSPKTNGSTFATLTLNGSNGGAQHFTTADSTVMQLYNDANAFYLNAASGKPIVFQNASTERARITSGGAFLVGTASTLSTGGVTGFLTASTSAASTWPGYFENTNATPFGVAIRYATDSNGAGNDFLYCVGNATLRAAIRSNGGLSNYQANNTNLSDRREKTNFAPAKSYLDTICAIPVQTFNYIDQSEDDPGLTLGVVAQDVQAVAPELVSESNWGTKENPKMRLSIYQTDLQYALMKCIQELKAQNDDFRARLAAAGI